MEGKWTTCNIEAKSRAKDFIMGGSSGETENDKQHFDGSVKRNIEATH